MVIAAVMIIGHLALVAEDHIMKINISNKEKRKTKKEGVEDKLLKEICLEEALVQ